MQLVNISGKIVLKKVILISFLLLISLFFVYLYYIFKDTKVPYSGYLPKMKQASIILTPVVTAIEKFKKDKERYPSSLKELIPQYISSIPKLPDGFFVSSPTDNGIDYCLLKDNPYQPYRLSVLYLLGPLSGDLELYYRVDENSIPTSKDNWKRHKYKVPINKNWIYCY